MTIKGGSKGKSFNDRELAGEVRSLTLDQMKRILLDINIKLGKNGELSKFQEDLLLRLAPNCLPRLHEHSGPDGGEIPLPMLNGLLHNHSDKEDSRSEETH